MAKRAKRCRTKETSEKTKRRNVQETSTGAANDGSTTKLRERGRIGKRDEGAGGGQGVTQRRVHLGF